MSVAEAPAETSSYLKLEALYCNYPKCKGDFTQAQEG